MANEIKAHLRSKRFGSVTVVAKIIDANGAQVGADVSMSESVSIPGLFIGSVPLTTPAGVYSARVEDDGDLVGVSEDFEWGGSEIVRAEQSRLIEASKRISNRQRMEGLGTATAQLVTFDDDGTTELYRDDLKTFGGENVITYPGVQTERDPQ